MSLDENGEADEHILRFERTINIDSTHAGYVQIQKAINQAEQNVPVRIRVTSPNHLAFATDLIQSENKDGYVTVELSDETDNE